MKHAKHRPVPCSNHLASSPSLTRLCPLSLSCQPQRYDGNQQLLEALERSIAVRAALSPPEFE